MFKTTDWDSYICDGDSITCKVDGFTITATAERDDDMREPWKEHDGRGIVSEWTTRDKRPGERVLHEDGRSKRYYDFERSIVRAKAEGWDAEPYGGTKGEQAARAVEADFANLKAWCNDEWQWWQVTLSVSKKGVMLDKYAASCGGIYGSTDDKENAEYFTEMANKLLDEALEAGRKALASFIAKLTDEPQAEEVAQ